MNSPPFYLGNTISLLGCEKVCDSLTKVAPVAIQFSVLIFSLEGGILGEFEVGNF
jgi:hypothetical protein